MRKTVLLGLVFLFFSASAFATKTINNCDSLLKNFPGTYKLTKRTLPNGSVLSGSDVQGTLAFTNDGYRVLAIAIHNSRTDENNAISLQSRYTLSSNKFTDKLDAFTMQKGKPTDPVLYVFDKSKKSSPVTCENGVLDIQNPPYDPLSDLKFTGTKLTAIVDRGPLKGIVDEWKRIG